MPLVETGVNLSNMALVRISIPDEWSTKEVAVTCCTNTMLIIARLDS